LPTGSIFIQSTTYHTWPFPALLFKRGTWAAIDLFFFLPNITMTFIGELEGKASKVKGANIFASIKNDKDNLEVKEDSDSEAENEDLTSPHMKKSRKKSRNL
jgi:hypothetical protein